MPRPTRPARSRRLRRAAFTLLEVMLVLVIIAAIAGIAVVNLGGFQTKALVKKTEAEISVFKNALKAYRLEMAAYPQQLEALWEKPSGLEDDSKWFPALEEPIEKDAWGNPYEYSSDGTTFEIRSLGPDQQSNTDDDIVG